MARTAESFGSFQKEQKLFRNFMDSGSLDCIFKRNVRNDKERFLPTLIESELRAHPSESKKGMTVENNVFFDSYFDYLDLFSISTLEFSAFFGICNLTFVI
ncbi:hypothetical protein AUK11_03785 [bacterium CG2_30_37_16]|nr:MAG: hypothetical protein AUK11_03785 [bacterium CG2_30_37_16]PIP30835.1 MAG: hypothetical protein COX25_02670 [bacterium (Candidatus Howlettbacteria) CG23_combo_of_CG06-09_8_20_14_all_37_9]PIX99349.1 MAG: hypothetical protein COZ22_02725 [bacterium (Candidatus Howlettbacteria) CG_4_10_14_3_um_filter_37_10]PJB06111.1 MAG: hypothetical protein CO123_02755 [bacterium (Candidatus Howlettbacteria) CG_4_9_14_3_um_filter_37_10]